MKIIVFTIILCLLCKLSFCQSNGKVDLVYGNRAFNNAFYKQVNTLDNYSVNTPLQVAGFGYSGRIPVDGRYRSGYLYGHWYYTQVIPQKIRINDTIKANINGYMVSIDIAGFGMFRKSKIFHMMGSLGFNSGRLRMHKNEWARQKNPFFSPCISLQPRILIGSVVLSFIASYEYDISSPAWRRTYFATKNKIDLEKFKETGATLFVCLGLPL
jgi:hypothetical protein